MSRFNTISIGLIVATAAAYAATGNAAITPWSHEQDGNLGFRFSYPRALFAEIKGDEKPSFHYFVSPNSDAKFLVGAWNNREGRTPDQALAHDERRRLRRADLPPTWSLMVCAERLPW